MEKTLSKHIPCRWSEGGCEGAGAPSVRFGVLLHIVLKGGYIVILSLKKKSKLFGAERNKKRESL